MATLSSHSVLFALATLSYACSAGTATGVGIAGLDAGGPDAGGSASANADRDSGSSPANKLTGTLGTLGATLPTASAFVISNSGETLIYMSSTPINCKSITTSRWLGSTPKGAQVVELIVKGAPTLGTVNIPPGEVNYAEGGKSSAYEVNAKAGSITFTKAELNGIVEGTVTASYESGNVSGSFHAEFCADGQGY